MAPEPSVAHQYAQSVARAFAAGESWVIDERFSAPPVVDVGMDYHQTTEFLDRNRSVVPSSFVVGPAVDRRRLISSRLGGINSVTDLGHLPRGDLSCRPCDCEYTFSHFTCFALLR